MKSSLTTLVPIFFAMHTNAQKSNLLIGDRVDYNEMNKQELAKTDEELSNNMGLVLGFGLEVKVVNVNQEIKAAKSKRLFKLILLSLK